MEINLKPCPFCGFQVDKYGLDDVLYPNGICWRPFDENENEYFSARNRQEGDNWCWEIVCNTLMGGCGAEMHGDSKEKVIEQWNRRV
jgi:hypothetical protein